MPFLFFVILVLRSSVWNLPFVRDAFGYAYVGSELSKGAILYKEVWDHKPPGVYILDAIIYKISPIFYLHAIKIFNVFISFAGTYFFYKLLRNFFDHKTSFISTILFCVFSNIYMLNQGDNMVEAYMVPLVVLIYYFFIKSLSGRLKTFSFITGILLGISFIFKQVGILPLIAIVIYVSIYEKKMFISRLFYFLAGIFSIVVPFVFYFFLQNAAFEALEAVFLYNFSYSGQGYSFLSIGQSLFYLLQVILATFLFWFLFLVGILKKNRNKFSNLFLLFFIFSFLGAGMGGKFAFSKNYLLLILPSMGYFVGCALEEIREKIIKKTETKILVFVVILFLLLPSVLLQMQAVLAGFYFKGIFNPGSRETIYSIGLPNFNFVEEEKKFYKIAKYVQMNVKEGTPILNWGAEPEMYLLTRTSSSTRFFYNFPLNGIFIKDNYLTQRRKIFIQELAASKPEIIVTNKNEERHKPSFKNLEFTEFKEFVGKNYVLEREIEGYLVFRLNPTL